MVLGFVTIDGIGGIGKTALAQEVATLCARKQSFDMQVWISAAVDDGRQKLAGFVTFATILNSIGQQLGVPEIVNLDETEKETRVHALLHRHRVLLVLDNLDTATEPQGMIARRLEPAT